MAKCTCIVMKKKSDIIGKKITKVKMLKRGQ